MSLESRLLKLEEELRTLKAQIEEQTRQTVERVWKDIYDDAADSYADDDNKWR